MTLLYTNRHLLLCIQTRVLISRWAGWGGSTREERQRNSAVRLEGRADLTQPLHDCRTTSVIASKLWSLKSFLVILSRSLTVTMETKPLNKFWRVGNQLKRARFLLKVTLMFWHSFATDELFCCTHFVVKMSIWSGCSLSPEVNFGGGGVSQG